MNASEPKSIASAAPPKPTFFHRAANVSAFAPVAAVVCTIVLTLAQLAIKSDLLFLAAFFVPPIIFLAGLLFGVVALFGISKYGKKGLLTKALVGICVGVIATGVLCAAIYEAGVNKKADRLKEAQRAQEQQAEVERRLKQVGQ